MITLYQNLPKDNSFKISTPTPVDETGAVSFHYRYFPPKKICTFAIEIVPSMAVKHFFCGFMVEMCDKA